jgi:putative ABC transport system permease protein
MKRLPDGSQAQDLHPGTLWTLLKAELAAGVFGLRLFIAAVAVAAGMLGTVWLLADGLTTALKDNSKRMLGGDLAVEVINSPLDADTRGALANLGQVSEVAELRTSARAEALRAAVELKAVDDAYPLYGEVGLDGADSLAAALETRDGRPGAVAAPALLQRLGIQVGDTIRLGTQAFTVRAALTHEPDRLASGGFMVGPRVMIARERLAAAGLTGPGTLAEYAYRLRLPEGADVAAATERLRALRPARGWDLERPGDVGERVRRVAERTTTFLGVAGLVALVIGLSGAWTAATVWVQRRGRTIALYRLSGATAGLVTALHAAILAVAGVVALALGLGLAFAVVWALMELVAGRLHLSWALADLLVPAGQVAATLALGLLGASAAALSAAARTPPGAAMRGGEASVNPRTRHVALGALGVLAALALAVVSLPQPYLAATAAGGLAVAALALGVAGWLLALLATRRNPRSFLGLVARQGLAVPGAAATKALALGIGIAGITAVIAAQNSLEGSLRSDLPSRAPDLVLIDVQPDQVDRIRARVQDTAGLGRLEATPFMRARILQVNGKPAEQQIVDPSERWVIEGDRSFSWSPGPTGEAILRGDWWGKDYDGPPLISAQEDVAEAFGLSPGATITYSVLGRTFTSEVVNVRQESYRSYRPDYLLVASPQPFREAPHSWIVTLKGVGADGDAAVDELMGDLAASAPNVTSIDVRRIVGQITAVIDGAILGSLAVAATLLLAGALTLAAAVTADVDARRREALAFTLIGASRREIAVARLIEAAAIGVLAALLGGAAGLQGGRWLADQALRVSWDPGLLAYLLPGVLGVVAAVAAGLAGGIGAVPRGRGQLVRQLAG